ncbi:ABC-type transporter Mla maintaining outer membrane lipid asymmetry, MlaB component, contains STAS domain [Fontimonas thermophila]|uniref:ABC-type transporter Mla maintaining outer membrane lipid asymmetry, MlaB component, contains STAS domain n=1 Tax=Fontimonas thermophila TaxID=1076937 RepID=A0A1I2IQY3_9GAMM|nr:STAS domain-containing protein [Fontimonas thermophila]SFF44058.1 ABC-type transporter Mla maintaining outer membrane lipid asymmetry, MlaB component, contains STAS domain [Fontimonas thermophila]
MPKRIRKTAARTDQRNVPLVLPADLGVEQAQAVYTDLRARVGETATVVIDGAAASRIHSAVLQLLCMFWRERDAAGLPTRWQAASPELRAAAALLGVDRMIQLSAESS